LLLGMMQDKDAISSLAPVAKLIPPPSIVSITVPSPRGLPASQLANIIESLGIRCQPLDEPQQGLAWMMEKAAAGVPTAATGSMLLAGWIRRHWGESLH
jgi:folylpolyglutamate synthase/dihydropteroate synthase